MTPIRRAYTAGLWACLTAGLASQAFGQAGYAPLPQSQGPMPQTYLLSPPPGHAPSAVQASMNAPAWMGPGAVGSAQDPYMVGGEPGFASGAIPTSYGEGGYGMGGCPGGGCPDTDDCVGGGFIGGGAVTYLKPEFEDNAAFFLANTGSGETTSQEFDYDYDGGYRVWLGWVSCSGLGFRGRYWSFDDESDVEEFTSPGGVLITGPELDVPAPPTGPSAGGPGAGDSISALSGIEVDVIDAEIMQYLRPGSWQMILGGGVRYASIDQFYEADVFDNPALELTDVNHDFDGIGPMVFAEMRRPLFSSGLAFVTNARGSILFGESEYEATDTFAAFSQTGSRDEDEALGIGEIQVGLEYAIWLSSQQRLYFQAAWEGQYWAGAGSAASTDGDLGFTGLTASAGLDW